MPDATFDAIVLGGGAAGLFCAAEAGRRGKRVLVIEHSAEVGRKILISGGGRSNFTNIHTRAENFLSANPHFAKSALARYTPKHFIALVEKHRIAWHEKKLGQLFCDGPARQIVDLLLTECTAAGVTIHTGCRLSALRRDSSYTAETNRGNFRAPIFVVASGGLSIPKIGATPIGYDIARQFGLPIQPCRPALVPLTFSPSDQKRFENLAGVSTPVTAAAANHRFQENLLFTHRGLSGPAILQASTYYHPGEQIHIGLLPAIDLESALLRRKTQGDRAALRTALADYLPKRLAHAWLDDDQGARPLLTASHTTLRNLAAGLHNWTVQPAGTEGYEKAEVTAGGVDTAGLSTKTLEAKHVPGLFFIGEVVDVTGQLGGFNFQWAWASAHATGLSL